MAFGRKDKGDDQKGSKRFVKVSSQGMTPVFNVVVDTQTGVNYLMGVNGLDGGVGITVLVDADGKPIVPPCRREIN